MNDSHLPTRTSIFGVDLVSMMVNIAQDVIEGDDVVRSDWKGLRPKQARDHRPDDDCTLSVLCPETHVQGGAL